MLRDQGIDRNLTAELRNRGENMTFNNGEIVKRKEGKAESSVLYLSTITNEIQVVDVH